ncbi:type III secretion system export apparatus subunit SctT [Roseateles sp. SL47]|uniref:type III secretion system export apparatus subunit SctT n=1 Tax=Roseateles sp. SL47 TaxID=2995138 RepID=UPI00226EB3E9|nr:type III secretion system export apparatus subunit SctT [Roseateles sp. SL47]WAC71585.1 type III secretion system export apparatus subunit SctT [Roseateles sp. SL47]
MSTGMDQYQILMEQGTLLRNLFALLSLCSARLIAAMLVMPATSAAKLPGMVRAGLPIWIGLFIAWGQSPDVVAGLSIVDVALLVLKEAVLGLLIGFAAGLIFWVAEGVGSMIDNLAGYNNVQQSNPNSSDQSTPVGSLLGEMAIWAFYVLGGMTAFLGMIFDSYTWWPLTRTSPDGVQLLERFAQMRLGEYMLSVARLSAPALLTLLLVDLGFGLLTKTAEKLEPNSMAQPVKGAVTMVMLSLMIGVYFTQLRGHFMLDDLSRELHRFFTDAAAR